jgi:hypothetical protein
MGGSSATSDSATSDGGHIQTTDQARGDVLERSRRALQVALGVMWLADAALQFQPFMFRRSFVLQTLSRTAHGNPRVLAEPILWNAHLVLQDVPGWNAVFATIQLGLAAGMLRRSTVRPALASSIVWALGVWWFGEGLGGVFTGTASPVSGAPGAVILYALLAVLVWPLAPAGAAGPATAGGAVARFAGRAAAARLPAARRSCSVAAASSLGAEWSGALWFALWGGLAFLALQPANTTPDALRNGVLSQSAGEPGWLQSIDHAAMSTVAHRGGPIAVGLAMVLALIAVGVTAPVLLRRISLVLAIVLAGAIWLVGENFGGILTGQGTDPNSGPLLIMLALAFWPHARGRRTGPGSGQAGNERATWEKLRRQRPLSVSDAG